MNSSDRLELADWRRRVADMYFVVRRESAGDPQGAWRHWRETRESLFREHPQSPVPAAARAAFRAAHWPYDPRYRFEATLAPEPVDGTQRVADVGIFVAEPMTGIGSASFAPFITGGLSLNLPISTGGEEGFTRIGWVEVPFPGGPRSQGVYWMPGYAGGIFLPFRDATNGHETYGAGRYLLDTAKSADLGPGSTPGSLVLDFNFAFHPSCAFDPKWSCPLAPPENRLDIRVDAGERLS